MMLEIVGIGLAGVTAALLVWWIGDLIGSIQTVRRQAGGEGPPPNIVDTLGMRTPVELVLRNFSGALSESGARIDQKLLYAGRPFGGVTGLEYVALLLVSAVGGFVLFSLLFTLASGSLLGGLGAGMVLGALPAGYFWLVADDRMENRKEQISREFPYFLDLVVMTQQAQATLPESFRLYTEAAPGTLMSEEVEQTLKDVALGTGMIEALQRLERRIAAEEVLRVIRALVQGEIEGSNRLELLREHSRDLRFRRWEKADRASEKLKAKIVMPAMLIVVSILLFVLAPAIVEMTTSGMF
ncbi:type II secretion system F family protein [Neorhizobium galegae]|uniref:type II secretion system F family protein n=1 Tax=Neorhizobium galegae TaxID=399 RepID=UPI0006221671|nr:type II secretion system F family protein [Neorhizobium galegae]CDZ56628.1 Flp pilus assembly protein TadC [Neorhizobium galegae bv. orientalis]KAB1122709.1 type II secretion system F family protein [Neorhizobium galegae]MCQ1570303.1 type II secretion system F family protein [Neorhizobium galegae]MCQ1807856.1 type II secretion system F family protein [Neorhizobium galegae]CDZ64309.1 Flp pilus assembly protein TadC [Neorhizobium galegae bv. orientalis]